MFELPPSRTGMTFIILIETIFRIFHKIQDMLIKTCRYLQVSLPTMVQDSRYPHLQIAPFQAAIKFFNQLLSIPQVRQEKKSASRNHSRHPNKKNTPWNHTFFPSHLGKPPKLMPKQIRATFVGEQLPDPKTVQFQGDLNMSLKKTSTPTVFWCGFKVRLELLTLLGQSIPRGSITGMFHLAEKIRGHGWTWHP